ncbi:arginyltransferase [Thalassoglobus polymorphus]|uniref:Aspartate/glutamate leucyltransferase n=1 Tax=Thalassoglobus polymorphus TaxID=2527994 RepID=A0A517QSB1_9PLAN|nr:arginyltransferase [Thalassoglobus polymorphus]QDT34529.1 arginyl-tRNA-protein transferase [Thalassoglobus polymorphus]
MERQNLPEEALRITESPRPCSYIPSETASLEYRLFHSLEPSEVEFLLERGWRRFGSHLFRPACENCSQCVPIRVDVENFQPTKSQRKAKRRNEHITVSLHEPGLTQQHLDLYNRWHVDMTDRRGWKLQQSSPQDYAEGFLSGDFPSLHELRYFDGKSLVGVGLIDLLPHSISSAYFYHDPDWRSLSPGTFSMICEIEFAQRLGLKHLYLGYWIDECPSMEYKNRFYPSETLVGYPADEKRPIWKPYAG